MTRRGWVLWLLLAGLLPPTVAKATLPEPQRWYSANGALVHFFPAREIAMVDIRVVFDAGSARDDNHPGLASLVNTLLAAGTTELQEEQIKRSFSDLGVQWSTTGLRDSATVHMRTLSERAILDKAVAIFKQLISAPTFPQPALAREVSNRIVQIRADGALPGKKASQQLWSALYRDHPYQHPPIGYEDSVAAVGRDELIRFHKKYYVARNMAIALVGDIDRQQAESIANAISTTLPAGQRPPQLPASPAPREATIEIPFASDQTHLIFAAPGVSRSDGLRKYATLYIANKMLGGDSLASDLGMEIRENRGLAYSIYSYFQPMRRRGPFVIRLQTADPAAAIPVVRKTVATFVSRITPERVASAQRSLEGKFLLGVDSNREIVRYLAMMAFYDLPPSYLNDFIHTIRQLRAEEIKQRFANFIAENPFALIAVGSQPTTE